MPNDIAEKSKPCLEALEQILNNIRERVSNISDNLEGIHALTPKCEKDKDRASSSATVSSLHYVGIEIQGYLSGIESMIARIRSG